MILKVNYQFHCIGNKRQKFEEEKERQAKESYQLSDSDEGEESEDEEIKVKKNIVAEINRRNAKEKQIMMLKQQKMENQKGNMSTPLEFKASIPNINFDFESKYPNSRYHSDFDEISKIGRGGGGHVYKVRNRLDNLIYAVKKVKLDDAYQKENDRILREVALLSRLQNEYIVRYYQAWIEDAIDGPSSSEDGSSMIEEEDSYDEEEQELNSSKHKKRHSASDYDFSISRAIPPCTPKYFDRDVLDENSDSSSVVFEQSDSVVFEQPDSVVFEQQDDGHSEKSQTVTNENKLLKKKSRHTPKESKKRKLYIQMEYCEKDTLRNLIENEMNNEHEIWRYTEQILTALHYIHSMDLLHRDLKPANIFLDSNFNVKLGDFGLAQEISHKSIVSLDQNENKIDQIGPNPKNRFLQDKFKEKIKHLRKPIHDKLKDNKFGDINMSIGIGTYYYMSPEQETQRNYNQKTDMFSLGIILFEMYAKMKSLMEKDKALMFLRTSFKVPSEYASKFPKNAVEMIEKLISQNPEERPSAEELLKSDFLDPENNAANMSLAQYTYYLDYPDFKHQFDFYSRQSDILNLITKGCKQIFEKHGAKFMESAMFKPLTNSFTVFVSKMDGPNSEMPKMGKKKSKKRTKEQSLSKNEIDYIKIDYLT